MAHEMMDRLYRRLGYTFKNKALIKRALTHCSMGALNNERFEFLGDSILSTVIAEALFNKFPDESEGILSRLRAFLVKGDTLAEIALSLELGDFLYLGQGELKSGGHRRASILSDALEAIFAAVYLDSDFQTARMVILNLYQTRLGDDELQDKIKDSKTQLQEYLQAKGYALPSYSLERIVGEEHDQVFHVSCQIKEFDLSESGVGITRRKAEQAAAKAMLTRLMTKLEGH